MVLPVLVLLVLGVAEYGRIYVTAVTVANAASAGGQFASQGAGYTAPAAIQQVARNDAGDQTLTVNSSTTCRCPGSDSAVQCSLPCAGYGTAQFYVAVTTSKTYSFLFHYPGLPQSIAVSRTATYRVSQ